MLAAAPPTSSNTSAPQRHGRRARYLAGTVLLVSLLAAGWVVTHRSSHTAASKTSVDQASSSQTPTATPQSANQTDQALSQLLASWANQYSFHSSVVVRELTGGNHTASYQATDSVVPASTYKIYVAYAI